MKASLSDMNVTGTPISSFDDGDEDLLNSVDLEKGLEFYEEWHDKMHKWEWEAGVQRN